MFSATEWRVFRIGIVTSLLAKGISAFSGAFSVDDILWINAKFNGALVSDVSARDGRFLYPYLTDILFNLGIDAPKATTLSAVILIVSLILSAQLACRVWRIENNFAGSLCVVLFATLHPYQVDFSTWKIGMLTGGLPLLVSMYGLWLASRSRRGTMAGAFAIAASLAVHQIGGTWVGVALCFSVIFAALDERENLAAAWVSRGIGRQILAVAAAVILYLLCIVLMRAFAGAPDHNELYGLSNLSLVTQFETFLTLILFHNPLFAPFLDVGFYVLILFFVVYVLRSTVARAGPNSRLQSLGIIILAFGGAWLCCIALPVITLQKEQMFARTMSAFGLFWGAMAGVLVVCTVGRYAQKAYVAIVTAMSIGFIGVNNQVLTDQARANERDIELGRTIIRQVEMLEGFQFVDRLAIVGTTPQALANLRTGLDLSGASQKNVGIVMSVFANSYENDYRVRLINETMATNFIGMLTAKEWADAKGYCGFALKFLGQFPAMGSVVRSGSMAIVCIGDRTAP